MIINPGNPEDYISKLISDKLVSNQRVFWLIPGGSAADIAVKISKILPSSKNLFVTVTDERYGEPGHPDENWQLLRNKGFNVENFHRILSGASRNTESLNFNNYLHQQIQLADFSIGLFGIGSDGHASGIKPGSIDMDTKKLAENYTGDDFERITTTPHFISQLDLSIGYANGTDKKNQLDRLINEKVSVNQQPAQSLKLAKEFILFTDQRKD